MLDLIYNEVDEHNLSVRKFMDSINDLDRNISRLNNQLFDLKFLEKTIDSSDFSEDADDEILNTEGEDGSVTDGDEKASSVAVIGDTEVLPANETDPEPTTVITATSIKTTPGTAEPFRRISIHDSNVKVTVQSTPFDEPNKSMDRNPMSKEEIDRFNGPLAIIGPEEFEFEFEAADIERKWEEKREQLEAERRERRASRRSRLNDFYYEER